MAIKLKVSVSSQCPQQHNPMDIYVNFQPADWVLYKFLNKLVIIYSDKSKIKMP